MSTFNTLFLFYKKPSVVLSRLFVCKIQPEVCGSVVSVAERLAGSLPDRWSSSLL